MNLSDAADIGGPRFIGAFFVTGCSLGLTVPVAVVVVVVELTPKRRFNSTNVAISFSSLLFLCSSCSLCAHIVERYEREADEDDEASEEEEKEAGRPVRVGAVAMVFDFEASMRQNSHVGRLVRGVRRGGFVKVGWRDV